MAKLKPEPRFSRRRVRLTAEEFVSLKEVGARPIERTIRMSTEIVSLLRDTFA
jgi:hypothetical protein